MSRYVLCGLVWLLMFPLAAADPPKPVTERDKLLARQLYRVAESAANDAEAIAALRKAIGYNPTHLMANVMLVEVLIRGKQVGPAVAQVGRLDALLKRLPGAPPNVLRRLAAAKKNLASQRKSLGEWERVKQTFAERYEKLSEPVGGQSAVLPSMSTALSRAALLKPEDKSLAERRDKALAALPKLPAPASKADPDGAALLREQAARHVRAYRYADALPLLSSAVSLDPANPEALCELGLCAVKSGKKALGAVCLLAARKHVSKAADATAARRMEVQIGHLLGQADPRSKLVARLDEQLSQSGKRLAERAAMSGDVDAARRIRGCLAALAGKPAEPGPGPVGPKPPTLPEPAPIDDEGNLARKINLDAEAVTVTATNARVQRGKDHIIVTSVDKAKPAGVTLTLGDLTFAGDSRFRWRLETATCENSTNFRCWPSIAAIRVEEHRRGKNWRCWADRTETLNKLAVFKVANTRAPYREDGVNEVCAETRGNTVTVWANSVKMLSLKLDREELKKASQQAMRVWIHTYGGQWSCKATLLELRMGKRLAADPTFGTRCLLHEQVPLGGGDVTGKIDLASDRSVELTHPKNVQVDRHRDHLAISAGPGSTSLVATLTLRELTFAHDTRIRWRIKPVGKGKGGDLIIGTWPPVERSNYSGVQLRERIKTEEVAPLYNDVVMRDDYRALFPARSAYKAAFNPKGAYEVCLEKRGEVVSTWVNRTRLSEVRLSAEGLRLAANLSPRFYFHRRQGTLGMKVSLVEATVAKELPPPAAAKPEAMAAPDLDSPIVGRDVARAADLSNEKVEFASVYPGTRYERRRDHFIMRPGPDAKKPLADANVILGQAPGAADARVRWRIEQLGAGPAGSVVVHSWPMPLLKPTRYVGPQAFCAYASSKPSGKTWSYQYLGYDWNRGYNVHYAPANGPAAFNEKGTYELCVEKRGRFVCLSINSAKLFLVDLSDEQRQEVATGPIQFWVRSGGTQAVKATLLELTVAKGPGKRPKGTK